MRGSVLFGLLLTLILGLTAGCGEEPGGSDLPEEFPEAKQTLPGEYDFDHDGVMETVVLEKVEEGALWTIRVMEDGWNLWAGNAAAAHMGWNNIFAGKINGKDFLMCYSPHMNQGVAAYRFEVFSLGAGGSADRLGEYGVDFDVNFGSPLHEKFDAGEIAAFLKEVHGNLENSTILLATQDGVLQTGGSGAEFWLDDPTGGLLRESENWEETLKEFSGDTSLNLLFCSGAGAWGTSLALQADGSFTGYYSDADMGDSGEGYPNGTVYICRFEGQFSEKQPLDEYSFSMTLESMTSDYEEGKVWIENGVRYISSQPYGIEAGTGFILYLPETPVEELDENFLSWWSRRYDWPDTLQVYGLWNVEMGYGFFG